MLFRSIVFIHGKGDGVLRKAILQELKYKYKNYESQDASFREYGFRMESAFDNRPLKFEEFKDCLLYTSL